ncbi:MAG: DUF5009 domain-containing protein [Lentisphaeria bacterium]|nr:DUF5009 domain-containing protein [Lentisphaeria bacterium]
MTTTNTTSEPTAQRLLSLDALRGFDMLLIIGGGKLVQTLANATNWEWAKVLKSQMTHARWHGFLAWDLIFPLFMFLVGVSIPYAIMSKLNKGSTKGKVVLKIVKRTVILCILGAIYNGGLRHFGNPRFASVLGQIGIAYCIAALVFLYTQNFKSVLLSFLVVSLFVTLAQLCIPVPGFGANILTPKGSMNAWLDQLMLPGRLYRPYYDPQGILCIFSSAGVTLLGVLTGLVLRRDKFNGYQKTGIMAGFGLFLVVLALAINPFYPINKEIWTTTFNLLSGGLSLLLLALFYLVIDVWKVRGSLPLRVVGMNAITIYMLSGFIPFSHPSHFFFGGIASLCGNFQPVVIVAGVLLLEWLLVYFLYKKKIFLKV